MSEDVGFVTMGQTSERKDVPEIGVGMLGYAFMGKAHSNALRKIPYMVEPLPAVPALVAICGRNEAAVRDAAARYGFQMYCTDWRDLIQDDAIQLFDNGGPNDTHAEPALPPPRPASTSFARSRWRARPKKQDHVGGGAEGRGQARLRLQLPLYTGLAAGARDDRTRRVRTNLSLSGGVLAGVDHGPAVSHGLALEEGHRGAAAPSATWARTSSISRASSWASQLPSPASRRRLSRNAPPTTAAGTRWTWTTHLSRWCQFANGAIGTLEASRYANGRKNHQRIEINGSKGSIVFNLERLNELEVHLSDSEPASHAQGFRQVLVTEADHPFWKYWWPPRSHHRLGAYLRARTHASAGRHRKRYESRALRR